MLRSPDAFIDVVKEAHRRIMAGRPEADPGRFKLRPNRAGTTKFVDPTLVEGTLREAHGLLPTLPEGLGQAAYLMFAIAEVHPFSDGNGRVSRAVMNAALAAAGHTRVIIVTGYREDYLRALKALSHQQSTGPYLEMLQRAQRFVSELPLDEYQQTVALLHETSALDASGDRSLRLPSELRTY
jgi:Fic family protein